jgi:hypothetical protein
MWRGSFGRVGFIKPTLCCCKEKSEKSENKEEKKELLLPPEREREKIGFLEFSVQS